METLKRYRLWAIVVSCCMIVLGAAMILRTGICLLTHLTLPTTPDV